MYYVYILQSLKDKSLYIGFTTDLRVRIKKHNNKEVTYSSKKAPFVLAWYCAFKHKDRALKFEKYLKIGSGFAFAHKHLI